MPAKIDKIVPKAAAAARLNVSVRTMERRSADGTGPKIVNPSPGVAGVFESELEKFLDKLKGNQMANAPVGSITTGLALRTSVTVPVGVSSLDATTALGTGACDLREGDRIMFAGDTQVYSLTRPAIQPAPGATARLYISPHLEVEQRGSASVTLVSNVTPAAA